MNHTAIRVGIVVVLLAVLGLRSASVSSDPVLIVGDRPEPAQVPLYINDAVPPLNMLVMGKDHKIYYEAYNDASDLNGDGILDVGYRGWEPKDPAPTNPGESRYEIDYYGYFNSYACYTYDGPTEKFVAVGHTANKQCSGQSGQWSGDFLNYLTMSRMDTLRRVLYGGWRQVDTANETVLQGAFFPQDAHSWGKEYQSVDRDEYDISSYAAVSGPPAAGRYHLFAVTTTSGNAATFPNYQAPLLRVMQNAPYRIWEWVSIEGPVAGNRCLHGQTGPLCVGGGSPLPLPAHPNSRGEFDALETTYAVAANRYGSGSINTINCGNNCNPHNASQDEFMTIFEGQIRRGSTGTQRYQFRVNGDDAIDFRLIRTNGTQVAVAGCYGGRGFGACGGFEMTAVVELAGTTNYNFKFRHEEAYGGEGYWLEFRTCNNTTFASCNGAGAWTTLTGTAQSGLLMQNTIRSTYDLTPNSASADSRLDYQVRVQACPGGDNNAAVRDATCKGYPADNPTVYKPTGILHDYGENQRMFFGLITGSQRNNLEGGQLRRNITNFASEINPDGTFNAENGIVRSIDRLRMIGGGYISGTDNLNGNSNWNWGNGNGNCPAPSPQSRELYNGECRMWGNPIAEMLYEGLRYFAGADGPTPRFSTGGSNAGNEDTTLGLPAPDWQDPYGTDDDGLNYPACARPNQTIISDINPSYDGDLPGSPFVGAITAVPDPPANIAGFDAEAEGEAIWTAEFGIGARNVFIGDVNGTTDGAPTAKSASSFGNIRGLSPEEPTKGGTYYSASVARFGRNTDINARPRPQNLSTYSIALASPLPRIEFPVGNSKVTLLPFAKTVSGTFGGGTRKPTNTIVDFYVQSFHNFPKQIAAGDRDESVNEGRAKAVFRINYEDVEQGNDHDMDSIVRYEVLENADGTVTVDLTSEYAAGSANQNVGYVISGTTRDGIYLEVRDTDSPQAASVYELNTPEGVWAGGCVGATGTTPCSDGLDFDSSRTFTPGTTGSGIQLQNPLWYAAKYGSPGPVDGDGDGVPDNWDEDGDGDPDNYFLVTNPLNLREQLSRAFNDITEEPLDVDNRAISGARVQSGSFTLQPRFERLREGKDWFGDVSALSIYPDGTLGPTIWSAQAKLDGDTPESRNIRTILAPGAGTGVGTAGARTVVEFQDTELGANNNDRLGVLGINPADVFSLYGAAYTSEDFVEYLRGDQTREASVGGTTNTLRARSSVLGDIVNSEPVVASPRSDFGYGNYTDGMFDGYANTGSGGYLFEKRSRKTVVYAGANDGMLHAFDGSTTDCPADSQGRVIACPTLTSGDELFAFIPNAALGKLGTLPVPDNDFAHRYFVDGQITIADAKDDDWKTLLVASTGAGARSIFALDVTDIDDPDSFSNENVLWERNSRVDNDIGHIYGKPLLVPLENDEWGVLFGNGYGGNLSDPSLYILDAFTGEVIRKLTADDGNEAANPNPIADFLCQAFGGFEWVASICARRVAPYNGLGQITAIDRNGNGKVDTVYGGDLQGHLWKFDLRDTNDAAWGVYEFATGGEAPLFTAETGSGADAERQPITGGIRVAAGPGGGVMVYFGTGRYFVTGDNNVPEAPQTQSLYAVFDNGPRIGNAGTTPVAGRDSLVAQTITAEGAATIDGIDYTTRSISRNPVAYFGTGSSRGWYLDLKLDDADDGNGERFIATPRIQSGRVFFTTYRPIEDSCEPGGINFQYGLDLLSGAGALSNLEVLPSGKVVCTDANCGGVAIVDDEGNEAMPPITNTGVVAINPESLVPSEPACDPDTESCPTFEKCQVVIYPGAFVLPRPCGRQSWRQLK